jgi:hypothetical protein
MTEEAVAWNFEYLTGGREYSRSVYEGISIQFRRGP